MSVLWNIALKEVQDGLRNRWIAGAIVLLGSLSLILSMLGSAPTGTTSASAIDVSVVSIASLTVYLIPLIALVLSYDALVGEFERGTMLLLLTYPVSRWQVLFGKFLGHVVILFAAILIGYGGSLFVVAWLSGNGLEGWRAYGVMMSSSLLLGAIFLALGYLLSTLVKERASAAAAAIGLWLVFVVLYDLLLFAALLLDKDQWIGQQLFSGLMLINPTDAYRIFNLSLAEGVSQAAGIAGVASEAGLSSTLLLGVMLLWVIAPLSAALLVFKGREL